MNNIQKQKNYNPFLQLILYKNGSTNNSDTMYHALVSSLTVSDDGLRQGAFKDITENDLRELRIALNSTGTTHQGGILPENTLYISPGCVCWWVPAARRTLFFTADLAQTTGLSEEAEYNFPALVLVSTGSTNLVFALPESARPDEDTRLMVPPFWNVTESGKICFGTAKVDIKESVKERMQSFENAFFLSKFSHTYGSSKRFKKLSLEEAWTKAQTEPFPVEQLLPSTKQHTLGSLVGSFLV